MDLTVAESMALCIDGAEGWHIWPGVHCCLCRRVAFVHGAVPLGHFWLSLFCRPLHIVLMFFLVVVIHPFSIVLFVAHP